MLHSHRKISVHNIFVDNFLQRLALNENCRVCMKIVYIFFSEWADRQSSVVVYAFDTKYCILSIVSYALYSRYCMLCIVFYWLNSIHCILSIELYYYFCKAFHSIYCTLKLLCYALCSMHCNLLILFHTMYSIVCILYIEVTDLDYMHRTQCIT